MRASSSQATKPVARKERSNEVRGHAPVRSSQLQQQPIVLDAIPAAGAHAARHLVNEDATPGAGVLPSYVHRFGKEVDGAAG